MKFLIPIFASCCLICAQGVLPQPVNRLQSNASPTDERFKVFVELEAKAAQGDVESVAALGEYYLYGQFPVVKNPEKAFELWVQGAKAGSVKCSSFMYSFGFPPRSTDSDVVIEKTKWYIINSVLHRMNYFNGDSRRPTKLSGVSDSSFAEAMVRAEAFLADVKIVKPASGDSSKRAVRASANDNGPSVSETPSPSLRFESLSLFDAHRKNVCAAYLKAAAPIYNKGDSATQQEKEAFLSAAGELVRLQKYIGKSRRLTLDPKSNSSMRELNASKMSDCYARMAAANIATTLPASRTDLNEASSYINALGQLMQLPVILGRFSK
jgi:hypothetical protein